MVAGRQRYGDVAAGPFSPIEAFAGFGSYAHAMPTFCADANLAQETIPPGLTDTHVRLNTCAMLTVWVTDSLAAIDPCPPGLTLAALAVVLVILEKCRCKILLAAGLIKLKHPGFSTV